MRLSVITGVLACALVFAVSSAKTEAVSINTLKINDSGVQLALMSETKEVPFIENKGVKEKPEEPVQVTNNEHDVQKGESLDKIAKKYDTTWKRLFDKNIQLEDPDRINPGDKIIIPEPTEEIPQRELPKPVVTVQAVQANNASAGPSSVVKTVESAPTQRGSSSGNGYVAGYCTWYVKNMRPDLPNNLGNAYSWVSRAQAQGMATGTTPQVGAVGQRGNHVVYVQSVNTDGTVTISEMNHKGLYVETVRTLPANYFTYIY